ncbi:hypothetical protein AHAS_Ahas20G0095900 [Arachis hypogaea]
MCLHLLQNAVSAVLEQRTGYVFASIYIHTYIDTFLYIILIVHTFYLSLLLVVDPGFSKM